MIKSISQFLCVCAAGCLIASAQAQVNGLHSDPRVFNDFSTSTLTINNSNSNPGNVTIDDRNWANDGVGGNGANRHDVRASTDAGASDAVLNPSKGYTISTTLTLSAGSNSPRKEAGIRFNSSNGGDGLFIVNTDAGEIVAFGAGAPFALFGNNAGGNGYVPGTPITLSETYIPKGIVGPAAVMSYSVNYPTRGINQTISSEFSNIELEIAGTYTFGVYAQGGPNTIPTNDLTDFITAQFQNVTISLIPEPASIGAIATGAALLLGRRRRLG
jgi:hypothetical protein